MLTKIKIIFKKKKNTHTHTVERTIASVDGGGQRQIALSGSCLPANNDCFFEYKKNDGEREPRPYAELNNADCASFAQTQLGCCVRRAPCVTQGLEGVCTRSSECDNRLASTPMSERIFATSNSDCATFRADDTLGCCTKEGGLDSTNGALQPEYTEVRLAFVCLYFSFCVCGCCFGIAFVLTNWNL